MATTVRIIGNTKAIKETLKKDGYKWNAEKSRWYQSFSDTHAEWLLSEETRDATLASFRMKYKGCQVLVGEVVVFRSKTYSDATTSPADSGLVLDLEDGMWKRRSECDIPAN